jgi:hypothetical protein
MDYGYYHKAKRTWDLELQIFTFVVVLGLVAALGRELYLSTNWG